MSDSNAPNLPDLDTAFDTIAGTVDYDCFMNKLASFGISPSNGDEAQALYELGWKLEAASESPQVKAASAGPFAQASRDLDRVLEQHGVKQSSANDETMAKAYAYAMQPQVYLSTLAIKMAEVSE